MLIHRLETFSNRHIGFVRVTTEDGSQGWGQLSTYNADITAQVLHRQVAPWALGADAFPIGPLARSDRGEGAQVPGLLSEARDGRPRHRALGPARQARRQARRDAARRKPGKLRAYASSMKRDITPDDEAARFARLRDRFGFDAFKFRIGAECGHDVDEWPGRTEEIVPAIRRALGPEVALLVDANSGFSPARAIEVGRLLEAEGVEHFEEPCPYWELEQTKQVADALSVAGDRRRAGLRAADLAADLRAPGGGHRAARRPLSGRHRSRAACRAHGRSSTACR